MPIFTKGFSGTPAVLNLSRKFSVSAALLKSQAIITSLLFIYRLILDICLFCRQQSDGCRRSSPLRGSPPFSGANAALQPSAAAGKCALSGCMVCMRPASSNAYIQSRSGAFPLSGANATLQPSAAAGKRPLSGCMTRIRSASPRLLQPETGQCGAGGA